MPAEEVERELERLREEASPLVTVEPPARQTGDFVELDLRGRAPTASPFPRRRRRLPRRARRRAAPSRRSSGRCAACAPARRKTDRGRLPADYPSPKLRRRNADVELHVHSVEERDAAPARRRVRARRVRVRHARRAARRRSRRASATASRQVDRRASAPRARRARRGRRRRHAAVRSSASACDELIGDLARDVERRRPVRPYLGCSGPHARAGPQALLPDAIGSLRRELALEALADREGIAIDDAARARLREELRRRGSRRRRRGAGGARIAREGGGARGPAPPARARPGQ